jgi:glycosyltransferase involved in cell wall biosynthesis
MACDVQPDIPVTIIVVTRNEEARLARCLAALSDFDEVIVVDSGSTDRTADIARLHGAQFIPHEWNGQYPKKRQWCLDHIQTRHDWIFFVDADEVVTRALCDEIRALDFKAAGYFVKGQYFFDGKLLRFGLRNNKLVLIDKYKIEFPVIDDLGLPGMGEIEGHYQPVLKSGYESALLVQLESPLIHYAFDDAAAWNARHARYAAWERGMNARDAWPRDPVAGRALMKKIFRTMPCRGIVAFVHCYIVKGGFLDGVRGFRFAKSRYDYYRLI